MKTRVSVLLTVLAFVMGAAGCTPKPNPAEPVAQDFLEALSRGAREGLALDTNGEAVAALRNHLDALKCGTAQLVLGDAVRYLGNQAPSAFDLVFLDPPFHQNLLQDACRLLETRGWLNPDAWIYTESESVPSSLGLPGNWRLHREKKAGNVHYALWQRGA